MSSIKRTFLATLLLTTLCLVSTAPTPSSTASATPAAASSSFPESGATVDDGSEWYPSGANYSSDSDGTAQPFMGLSKGGQIGVIVGVILVGLLGLGGLVFFYFHRRRSWEREVLRRSTIMAQNQNVILTEHGQFVRANSYSAAVAAAAGNKKSGSPTSSNFSREDVEKNAAAAEESSIGVRSEFGVTRSEFDRETVQESQGRWGKIGKLFARRG